MRIFKTKPFAKFARRAGLADGALLRAVADAERGLVGADLGGGVLKLRVARPGHGKSGGFRTIVAFCARERAIFVHGFAKSERDNIDEDELRAFKSLAAELLGYNDARFGLALTRGALIEVAKDG